MLNCSLILRLARTPLVVLVPPRLDVILPLLLTACLDAANVTLPLRPLLQLLLLLLDHFITVGILQRLDLLS